MLKFPCYLYDLLIIIPNFHGFLYIYCVFPFVFFLYASRVEFNLAKWMLTFQFTLVNNTVLKLSKNFGTKN